MKYKKSILTILIGTSLVLSGCGGGGGGSTPEIPKGDSQENSQGGSHTPTAKPGRLQRHALEVEDIPPQSYHDNLVITPRLDHLMGTATFSIIDSEPQDIAQIEPTEGTITVFKPGTLTIKVTDTSQTYEDSEATFTVIINKGVNNFLEAEDREIAVESSHDAYITARNSKGKVTYDVAENSRHLLEIDALTGKLIPLAAGEATVIINDEGNDRFAPTTTEAKVTIKAISPSTLSFSPRSVSYAQSLLLDPWRVSGNDNAEYRYSIKPDADPDVISIDEKTGQMTVNKIGKTVVEVTATYSDHYDRESQTATFEVNITEGLRTAIIVESQAFPYVPGKIIQPNVSHAIATPRYTILNGEDVIKIDETTGYLQIIGVGGAYLEAIDDGNPNYMPSEYRFTLKVEKGEHPGLKHNTVIQRTYSEDLIITPHIEGQYGDLSIVSTSPNVSISDDKVAVEKAGTTNLTVTDSGGRYYHQSPEATVVLNIARAIHPAMTVSGLTTDYTDKCFAIDSYIEGAMGDIVVTANSNPDVAKINEEQRCIQPLNPGSTDFTFFSQQSDNYEASTAKTLPVIIKQAGTTLQPSGDVWGFFGSDSINPPTITGKHGSLQFEIADNAATDIVDIDADSGSMKVLNAGTTRIKVTDSGTEQYQSAATYFNVTVKPTTNMVGVSYPTGIVFEPGKRLLPAFTNLADGMSTTFELTTATASPVKLLNAKNGELEIQSAGDYSLKVTAVSRNYQQIELTVKGTIHKAPHPGIATEPVQIEYSPLKTSSLSISQPAIGKRIFSMSGEGSDLISVNANTGELTLLDFSDAKSTATVLISENEGDNNYQPLALPARQSVVITAPRENASHKDFTLDKTGSIFASRLNSTNQDYRFRNLKDTKVSFAGVRTVPAQNQQLIDFGTGVNLSIPMIPEGEEDTILNRKPVLIYAQRFDGCPYKYNLTTVSNGTAEPVTMGDYTSCSGEDTNRYLTFTVIDDHHLTAGINWQAVSPFVVYRQSDRPFKPTANGGCYQGNYDGNYHGCPEEGLEEPSVISEWNRVDVRIAK